MFQEALLFLERADLPLPSSDGALPHPVYSPARQLLMSFRHQGVTRETYAGFQPVLRGRGIHVPTVRALATG